MLIGGTYRIEGVLGVGGMGVVAAALDERLQRRVAIKFVKPSMMGLPQMKDLFAATRPGRPAKLRIEIPIGATQALARALAKGKAPG